MVKSITNARASEQTKEAIHEVFSGLRSAWTVDVPSDDVLGRRVTTVQKAISGMMNIIVYLCREDEQMREYLKDETCEVMKILLQLTDEAPLPQWMWRGANEELVEAAQ